VSIAVDPQRLRRHLQTIIGERSPFSGQRHLAAVESFVEGEFQSYGLRVENDFFRYRGTTYRNIIGQLGGRADGPLVILGAHIDAVPGTPGADDNASGVAALLEAARLLASARMTVPMLFCAFNLEELNMVGSTAFAQKLKSATRQVKLMISLEMVGYTDSRPGSQQLPTGLAPFYPDRGDFIGVIGNWNSNPLLRTFAAAMRGSLRLNVETLSVPGKGGLVPAVRLSDHAPFWDLGYPALMVTDTAFYRNPNYHKPSDSLETLDLDFLARVCEGVVRGVAALVN